MGEHLNHLFAVVAVVFVECRCQSHHQVRPSCPHVFQGLTGGFQLDDIWDFQFLEHQFQHVDVETLWLAVLVQKHVWPKVPRIFINKRVLLRILFLCCVLSSGFQRRQGCHH